MLQRVCFGLFWRKIERDITLHNMKVNRFNDKKSYSQASKKEKYNKSHYVVWKNRGAPADLPQYSGPQPAVECSFHDEQSIGYSETSKPDTWGQRGRETPSTFRFFEYATLMPLDS